MGPLEKGGGKHGRDGQDGVINDGLIKKGDILPLKGQKEQDNRIMVLKSEKEMSGTTVQFVKTWTEARV